MRRGETNSFLVTYGNFTYVAIDDQGKPRAIVTGDAAPVGA
jgi:acyl-CoA hydrolase